MTGNNRVLSTSALTKVAKQFPEIDDIKTVLQLLPSGTYTYWKRTPFYYIPAIYEMATTVEDFENRALARVPRATEDFEEYKTFQKAKVAEMLEAASIYRTWLETRRKRLRSMDAELTRKWEGVFTSKLLALGHDLDDIKRSYWSFDRKQPLTEDGK
ncbi:hypothetical protein FRB97_002922 [Tulasnella sp. 331]|nr:hypothetical protein FRB97_002922 [Tulasnella sp. 331]KAG8889221.1 hypothetical protein FRB98_005414 [Tulasnella sp. 332]